MPQNTLTETLLLQEAVLFYVVEFGPEDDAEEPIHRVARNLPRAIEWSEPLAFESSGGAYVLQDAAVT